MGCKHTNDHCWDLKERLFCENLGGGTAELGIDLHTDVGAVLGRSLYNIGNVEHLKD